MKNSVRKALAAAGIDFKYLEYGSYFSSWKPRLAIKLWSGWPTFPQVFVKGELLGGEELTVGAIADGSAREDARRSSGSRSLGPPSRDRRGYVARRLGRPKRVRTGLVRSCVVADARSK